MNTVTKILTCILGALAALACLATIGIIGYALIGPGDSNAGRKEPVLPVVSLEEASPTLVPAQTPGGEGADADADSPGQIVNLAGHVHDYEETIVKKATCFSAGQLKYACACGDTYYVDILSTGHVAGDWELVRKAERDRPGLRVQKCIYCDDIMAQETVYYTETESGGTSGSEAGSGNTSQASPAPEATPHIHQYTATTEREPTCILAGLRMYRCSCGSFYTENIPAPGHVASDWRVVEEPTTTYMGLEQRICQVCSAVLDSRRLNMLTPSPAATSGSNTSPAASGSSQMTARPTNAAASATPAGTPAASGGNSGNAVPTATPHQHNYVSYVIKPANCTEQGIMSYVCSCGSSDSGVIERDLNNHSFRSTIIPPTRYSQGYTIYTCIRCNYQYMDNYTPLL